MSLLQPDEIWKLILVVFGIIVVFDILLAIDKVRRNTISQVITDRAKKRKFWIPLIVSLICFWLPYHFFGDALLAGDWKVIAGFALAFILAPLIAWKLPI